MTEKQAEILVRLDGSLRLRAVELWPDGDAPMPTTAEAVIDRRLHDDLAPA